MPTNLDNMYYRRNWHNCSVDYYEGYKSTMTDFHMHDYYEISLILSGKVKVLLPDHVREGTEPRIVLASPKTPHLMSRHPDIFYSRLNLLFSDEFIADYIPEWKQLSTVFGKAGRVVTLSPEQTALCKSRILEIQAEKDPFRQRLMILCLLSLIAEIAGTEENDGTEIPRFVSDALTYISTNYAKKILASELAWSLGVGRTTLMTAFKKYIGCTLNDYVIRFRVKSALRLLREGKTEQEAAEVCGFSDTCSLIRSFKRCYGKTPRQYLLAEK
ncbi:MAG: helix-turn-helix transcriptional regulator [Clostridia bacterium]|nr:helix-turn-helix transcriptional regulator [Clostridia bacterium]